MTTGARVKVGMARAFLGHYPSVGLIREFIRQAGFDLVLSPPTTPAILEAGTTLASADYCLPLRVFVGHIHHLCRGGDLDFLVCPNVYRENPISSTCAKYRDTGGVAIRSLAGALGYTLRRAPEGFLGALGRLVGDEAVDVMLESSAGIPTVLDPNVWALDEASMRNLCYRLYLDLTGATRRDRVMTGLGLRPPSRRASDQAFDRALEAVESGRRHRWEEFTTTDRVRLVLLGRDYLVEDPLLSADLKPFFQRAGVQVLTSRDVPWGLLESGYRSTRGYYDVHRTLQSLLDLTLDVADGYVIASSFGCHPDAFMMEGFLDAIRDRGVPAWLLKYDEQTGSAGYRTRYETIHGFLDGGRGRRGRGRVTAAGPGAGGDGAGRRDPRPAVVWPHFTPNLDLIIEEVFHHAGLAEYLVPPLPATEDTVARPDIRFIEACCPYAITTGSLLETLEAFLDGLEERAGAENREVEPHHIMMAQASGEGPCTFGWYSMAQEREVPRLLRERLERHGHSIAMATVGLDGGMDMLEKLVALGDHRRLRPILRFVEASQGGSWAARQAATAGLVRGLWPLVRIAFSKLRAIEDVRARWLVLKAHELEPGSFGQAYAGGLGLIRRAHDRRSLGRARKAALELLDAVPRDSRPAPRVAVVGEIYVCLSSFANRGTVENLLGRERVEVVEGVTLSGFIGDSLREMRRRLLVGLPGVRSLKAFLDRRDVSFLDQKVRDTSGRPFGYREFGGEGVKCVGLARKHIEDGVDGIVHVYPFKCMPEGMAKDALREMCDLYGVRYLPLTFHRETEMERLRTEVSTFAALLHMELESRQEDGDDLGVRRQLGRVAAAAHDASRAHRHLR